ncbi:MAG TPA: MBL fold metallo-hydrolase, partial [Thermoanaerobaculia bacterium]|nr:MBL fold metallo-hydrolase [Thermoanaerobaculia bacterium]
MSPLSATMLGSGTSSGVPVIGCRCAVCTSTDPRNRRLRPSLRLDLPGGTALVDTPPDLREQALASGLARLDAVLFTHAHADHIFGLDDVRIFNFRQGATIPCHGSPGTLERVRSAFSYVFEEGEEGGGKPKLELVPVTGPFDLLGARVEPVPVWHGPTEVLGYRIGGFAYVTDVNRIPEESFAL